MDKNFGKLKNKENEENIEEINDENLKLKKKTSYKTK